MVKGDDRNRDRMARHPHGAADRVVRPRRIRLPVVRQSLMRRSLLSTVRVATRSLVLRCRPLPFAPTPLRSDPLHRCAACRIAAEQAQHGRMGTSTHTGKRRNEQTDSRGREGRAKRAEGTGTRDMRAPDTESALAALRLPPLLVPFAASPPPPLSPLLLPLFPPWLPHPSLSPRASSSCPHRTRRRT